jgi:hypothetical protein
MLQIPLDIAATRLAELMDTATHGELDVIVKGDQAVRLVPVPCHRRSVPAAASAALPGKSV